MKRWRWIMLLTVFMLSCEKEAAETEKLGQNAGIVGTWIEAGQDAGRMWLNRSGALDPDRYGFTLEEDGAFIEHKNAGWCGTPPITYAEYEGTWLVLSDSLLEVTVGYWGGTMTYQMRIVSLDEEQLSIRFLYGEDRASAR